MADTTTAPAFAMVPDTVRSAGAYVQQTAAALVQGIHTADADIRDLTATWKSAAADAYVAGWEETRKGALEVLEALNTMADLLGVSAASIADTDTTRAAATTTATSSLDLP
jgi:WXG100 family type VII secretion target